MSKFKILKQNWCQNLFQDQINVNFKVLGLNWYQKNFQDQIDINFKILGLKRLFTLKIKWYF